MTITSLLDPIRREQGCRSYQFFRVTGEKDSFVLIGEWETLSDWDRHVHSEHFAVLSGSQKLLSPEKRFDFKLLSSFDEPVTERRRNEHI